MKIALLGDIGLFGKNCLINNPDFYEYSRDLRIFLKDFDYVIGNLETPFSIKDKGILGKSALIKSHPINIKILKYLGISHVNLSNNHIGDYKLNGYNFTKYLLKSNRINWFGTENKTIKIINNNNKIILSGYCCLSTNPSHIKIPNNKDINYLDYNKMIKNLVDYKNKGFFNIVSIHHGIEHIHLVSSEDIKFARNLSTKIDYIYYGHHPHVLQPFEQINNSKIFYSLGNCLFDDVYRQKKDKKPLVKMTEANRLGGIATIEIKSNKVINNKLVNIYLSNKKIYINQKKFNKKIIYINKSLNNFQKESYNLKRSKIIKHRLFLRKKKRNFHWYIQRLNINSFIQIINSIINFYLYKKKYLMFIKNL